MKKYNVKISKRADGDIEKIVSRKREFDTTEGNINEFLKNVDECFERLELFPNSGSDLSSRLQRKTTKQYFVIEERYLMIYAIMNDKDVKVSRVLDSKSNWQVLKL